MKCFCFSRSGQAARAMWRTLAAMTILATLAVHPGAARAEESPARALRIDVLERGIHKITGRELAMSRIRPSSIDVANLMLESNGEPVAFFGEGLEDGQFGFRDAIYFFAEGPEQANVPFINVYEDYRPVTQVFMLHVDEPAGESRRFEPTEQAVPLGPDPAYPVPSLKTRRHFEQDPTWYFPPDKNRVAAGLDYMFWERLTFPRSTETDSVFTTDFDLPELAEATPVDFELVVMVGRHDKSRDPWTHHIRVSVNGHENQFDWEGIEPQHLTWTVPGGVCRAEGNQIEVELLEPVAHQAGRKKNQIKIDMLLIDSFEVEFQRATRVQPGLNEWTEARSADPSPLKLRLEGFVDDDVLVLDLASDRAFAQGTFPADGAHAMNLELDGEQAHLVAIARADALEPFEVEGVELAGIFERPDDAELLIITHPVFLETLEPFVQWKRSRGLRVSVINVMDIFHEHSGGYANPESVRAFIKHVYESRSDPALRYVLLVGDSATIAKYQTYVPAYAFLQSGTHANENYFATLEGDPLEEPKVAVGRFSVRTPEQLEVALAKTMDYEQRKHPGLWRSRFLMIAASFRWARDDAGDLIDEFVEPNYVPYLMQTDMTTRDENYHEKVSAELSEMLNKGSLMTFFFGHGGGTVWEVGPSISHEQFRRHLFDQSHVAALTNQERPTVVMALTCYTNDFDNPDVAQTLGETFVNSAGGAVAVIGAASRTSVYLNARFNKAMMELMRDGSPEMRLGDYFVKAKNEIGSQVSNSQYIFLGDPSLEFAFPSPTLELENVSWEEGRPLRFEVVAPEGVGLSGSLDCVVMQGTRNLTPPWQAPAAGRRTAVEYSFDPQAASGSMRLVVYGVDAEGRDYTGHAILPARSGAHVASGTQAP